MVVGPRRAAPLAGERSPAGSSPQPAGRGRRRTTGSCRGRPPPASRARLAGLASPPRGPYLGPASIRTTRAAPGPPPPKSGPPRPVPRPSGRHRATEKATAFPPIRYHIGLQPLARRTCLMGLRRPPVSAATAGNCQSAPSRPPPLAVHLGTGSCARRSGAPRSITPKRACDRTNCPLTAPRLTLQSAGIQVLNAWRSFYVVGLFFAALHGWPRERRLEQSTRQARELQGSRAGWRTAGRGWPGPCERPAGAAAWPRPSARRPRARGRRPGASG